MEDDDIYFAVLREFEDEVTEWESVLSTVEGLGKNWTKMVQWLLASPNEIVVHRTKVAINKLGKSGK